MSCVKPNVRTLSQLAPDEFENLVFDLAWFLGLHNVAWRTPGADGGRDIEAFASETDISGAVSQRKWYIECKRYAKSVDWPTIYPKLAYAHAHDADYLLMCTTAKFTPAAISQVEVWNRSRKPVVLRLWPGHELHLRLSQFPDLLSKYGLATQDGLPGKSFLQLSLTLSKSVASHYSKIVFNGAPISPMLEAAQAFADLLAVRMADIKTFGRIQPLLCANLKKSVLCSRCTFASESLEVDSPALRAFLSYLVALTDYDLNVLPRKQGCEVASTSSVADHVCRYHDTFIAIAIWGDFEFDFRKRTIQIRQRL